jgi:hypothetical protein
MNLHLGDRLTDETGEWKVASRPYVTSAGKDAHVRVRGSASPRSRRSGAGARMSA